MNKVLKISLLSVAALLGVLLVAIGIILSTNVFVNQFHPVEDAVYYTATVQTQAAPPTDSIKVMNWNVKFGGGRIDFFFDCYGDRVTMTEAEVVANMEGLARKIKQYNPDLLLLQEADLPSNRSAMQDMVQWLLDHTDLNYGVYASQWDVAYIPKHGIGKVNSGNAILSRWPLKDAQRYALPQMETQDALTRFFYLRRNILQARLDIPSAKPVYIINTHLEAYTKDDTRNKQLALLTQRLDELKAKGADVVFGGDLNTLPPGTKKLKGFDDSVCQDEDFVMDDYTAEQPILLPFYAQYREAIPLEVYQQDETRYYSHTVNGKGFWNRRLDYLFSSLNWKDGLVHQNTQYGGMETMPLSDHAPLTATLLLPARAASTQD